MTVGETMKFFALGGAVSGLVAATAVIAFLIVRRAWRNWRDHQEVAIRTGPDKPAALPAARALTAAGRRYPVIGRRLPAITECVDTCYSCGAPVRSGYACDECGEYRRADPLPGGTDKSGTIGQTPRTRSTLGDPFSLPTGDVGCKAPAADPKPPKIPERSYSILPGGGRRRYGKAPPSTKTVCDVCGAGPLDPCDAGLHS